MKHLFLFECKKIITDKIYWLFIAAITVVFVLNYGNIDTEEIHQASQNTSVFYIAKNNQYAPEQKGLSDKGQQKKMMSALTSKLLYSYRNNSYEYYPFGYIKEKSFSESEQAVILKFLKEITGMSTAEISDSQEETSSNNSEKPSSSDLEQSEKEQIKISGGGAYIAKPGAGSINEAGEYIFEPDEWEYTDVPVVTDHNKQHEKEYSGHISIQVSFHRFMEIMNTISKMIGRNSYFSLPIIKLYYDENNMDASPITLKQHKEFYEQDRITGAFARYFCDSIALALLFLPSFVIIALMIKDNRHKVSDIIYTRKVSGYKLIFVRYSASVLLMLFPIFMMPLKSFITLVKYAYAAGNPVDLFAFPIYIFGWTLPTLLFITALSLFLAVLTESSVSILFMGILGIFFKPTVSKIAGGNYELFDIVIRHNTLKGYGRMMQQLNILVINRLFITASAFLLVFLSSWVYQIKRKGGLSLEQQKFIHHHIAKF